MVETLDQIGLITKLVCGKVSIITLAKSILRNFLMNIDDKHVLYRQIVFPSQEPDIQWLIGC